MPSELAITIIDVGWGDSILVESKRPGEQPRYGLIDCNDYEYERSAFIFIKRYFDRNQHDFQSVKRNFEWVLLTHGHADHSRGVERMLRTFGAEEFWYPKSVKSSLSHGLLLNYATSSANHSAGRVGNHEAIDRGKDFSNIEFGDVSLEVLWPEKDTIDSSNENNNSVVLALTLGQVSFITTGDAEGPIWPQIVPRIPPTARVFLAPHHGARNGMFAAGNQTPWLNHVGTDIKVAMSSHIRPHGHPHPDVIAQLDSANPPIEHFRTDRHYHLTFRTDGTSVDVQYSHDKTL